MMAHMLPSSPRVSQNLPIPKCSTCGQFVPLEELGEHICAPPPPLPKPAPTPADVHALLPKRLQGRVPSRNRRGTPSRSASRSPPLSIDISSSAPTRPQGGEFRAPTPSTAAQPTSASRDTPTTARPSLVTPREMPATPRPTPYPPSPVSPPRNTPPNQQPPFPVQARGVTPLGYRGPPRGPPLSTQSNMLPRNMVPPRDTSSPSPQRLFPGTVGPGAGTFETLAPRQSLVPPPERGIDTMSGGEAGMAGVGRRGFAAVARAAMFGLPDRNLRLQPQRGTNQSRYLDIDAQSRQSGNSSSSPEPTSPLPQSEVATQPIATRTPSPPDRTLSTPIPPESVKYATSDNKSANSPLGTRLPFFEKFRNNIPGNNTNTANNDSSISPLNSSNSTSIVRKKTIDSVSLNRSTTSSSTSSRPLKDVRRPISPIDSESEYGGLAYADSIDNDSELSRPRSKNSSHPGMPGLVLRTGSSSSGRRRQPSGSELSDYSNDRPIMIGSTIPRLNRSRTPSASSISGSEDEPSTRARANSAAAIAHALGLSQTPPSDYGKMGGPGVTGGRRSDSVSRRNADPDSLEEMEKALEEAKVKTRNKQPSFGSSSQQSLLYRADTSSSIATSRKGDNVIENGGGGVKAQRSNTIQTTNPSSSVKLPMRSLTSPKFDRDKALDGTGVRKERVRKSRVCLKCLKAIASERWVSVDAGALCERCWKNMYLPKCRRCNLSIEKQAVSSSDGQLKGKYHKECFNCDTCHKPFPDKSFYVYDGKPLCAYHYHEANNSLCAATRCGQPIEGPCAVSHSGDRYHPEHMTCEHSGYPPCKQMLSEYWEIDGKMLCERHANSASVRGSDVEDEEWTKSKRRVTRFVDLTGGIEDVGGSELR